MVHVTLGARHSRIIQPSRYPAEEAEDLFSLSDESYYR
jgi:hypothetical protein